MKKIIETTCSIGLDSLLGEEVLLLCANYFYAGELIAVNGEAVELKDASIVYETGEWSAKSWKDAQKVGGSIFVRTQSIEAYMRGK
jgi:hypothetical protein